ncbi:hypothetical protein F4777DRAFT_213660 [Nemania sp. FL0916]|nr:hypothetical protein F4777DRAFT_213660 [Nemania sp. FL0916]
MANPQDTHPGGTHPGGTHLDSIHIGGTHLGGTHLGGTAINNSLHAIPPTPPDAHAIPVASHDSLAPASLTTSVAVTAATPLHIASSSALPLSQLVARDMPRLASALAFPHQPAFPPQHVNYNPWITDGPWNQPDAEDVLVLCAICGSGCKKIHGSAIFDYNDFKLPDWMQPILVQAKPEYLEWRKENHSTRQLSKIDYTTLIDLIKPTKFAGGPRGMRLKSKLLPIDTRDPLLRIPVHKACFDIAERFCKTQARYQAEFRSPSGGAPYIIPHLYEIWCNRAIASCPEGPMDRPILEASSYFGAPITKSETTWFRTLERDRPSMHRLTACPLDVPGLTDIVFNALQTMDGKEIHMCDSLACLWRRCLSLPRELLNMIVDALEPFEDGGLPLQPTRVLPPSWWKTKLLSGTLIPWLWDLNEAELMEHRVYTFYGQDKREAYVDFETSNYVFDEDMWDWELLCRQLAQPDIFEIGGLLRCESNLWNRRRIWKLLETARLGHVTFPKSMTSELID